MPAKDDVLGADKDGGRRRPPAGSPRELRAERSRRWRMWILETSTLADGDEGGSRKRGGARVPNASDDGLPRHQLFRAKEFFREARWHRAGTRLPRPSPQRRHTSERERRGQARTRALARGRRVGLASHTLSARLGAFVRPAAPRASRAPLARNCVPPGRPHSPRRLLFVPSSAMPRLDTLLAMHAFCDASPWSHVDVRDAMAATVSAAGLSPGMRLPREFTGDVVLRALSSLDLDVSSVDSSILTSIALDDPRSITRLDERVLVSANKLAVLFCLLCGGSLGAKLGAVFLQRLASTARIDFSNQTPRDSSPWTPRPSSTRSRTPRATTRPSIGRSTRGASRRVDGSGNIRARPWTDADSARSPPPPSTRRARRRGRTRRRGRVRFQRARGSRSDEDTPVDDVHVSNQSNADTFAAVFARVGLGGGGAGSDRPPGHRRNVSAASAGSGDFFTTAFVGTEDRAGLGTSARRPRRRRAASRLFDGISSGYTRGSLARRRGTRRSSAGGAGNTGKPAPRAACDRPCGRSHRLSDRTRRPRRSSWVLRLATRRRRRRRTAVRRRTRRAPHRR